MATPLSFFSSPASATKPVILADAVSYPDSVAFALSQTFDPWPIAHYHRSNYNTGDEAPAPAGAGTGTGALHAVLQSIFSDDNTSKFFRRASPV